MRKCRTVELKHCNELFLQFLCNYDTPEREHYREIYESADMDERKKKAKGAVRADGDNPMRDMSDSIPSGVRSPA